MAKRVKFLKAHVRHTAGEISLITDAAANYLIRVGVAIEIKDDAPHIVKAPTVEKAKKTTPKAEKTSKKAK